MGPSSSALKSNLNVITDMKKIIPALSLILFLGVYTTQSMADQRQAAPPVEMAAAAPVIESAFSPEAGGENLVLKVIYASKKELRLAAYSFTSPTVVKALLAARQRGVDVRVIVDYKRNLGKSSLSALRQLTDAGIAVKTNAFYALHHDKYIVVDGQHVQNGSFNYTSGAADSNSENVLVVWNDPVLAAAYIKHWDSRWEQGVIFPAQN